MFCLASDSRKPEDVDLARAEALTTRYYSPEVARGAFALPPFIAELVAP